MDRRTLLGTSSAGAMLVIAIAATLNVLGQFAHLRLDFSQGKVYSVSGASKRVLRGLPDPVVVKVFESKQLPSQVASNGDYARDLLHEYRAASNGKVRVQVVDTDADPKARDEALREGIAPMRFDIYSRDRREQREGFLGVSLRYREKRESIPFLQDVNGLEYDLTSRIKTLTAPSKPVLAFLNAHGALGAEALDPALRRKLESRYALRALDFSAIPDDGFPQDVQSALLFGPQEKLSDRELWLLDQFLLSGRSLGVAVDTKRVDMRAFHAADLGSNLPDFLAKHGVRALSTLVLDAQCQPIQVQLQQGFFAISNIVEYPPFVVSTALDKENVITKGLDSIVLPFVSPIEVTGTPGKAEVLARSSPYSWAKPEKTPGVGLNPFQLEGAAPNDLKGPFGLAAAVEAEFAPAYPTPPKGVKAKAPLAKASRPGRLVVIGTSKVVSHQYHVPETNYAFLLNLVDWLALDAELIGIRSKTVAFRPLREIPAASKALVRYALIFGPALLAVALGLLRWRVRRLRRARRVAEYGLPPAVPPPAGTAGSAAEPAGAPAEAP